MGYWSNGKFIKSGPEGRKQLNEVRAVVDQVVANVECGAITPRDALRELLSDHPVLKQEHRDHPLIKSGLMALYTEFWCPKLKQTYKRNVHPVTFPALLREEPSVETLEVLPRLDSSAE